MAKKTRPAMNGYGSAMFKGKHEPAKPAGAVRALKGEEFERRKRELEARQDEPRKPKVEPNF
jgi:hypothetical protein